LVVSVDLFNRGPSDLVVVCPITKQAKGIPFHVEVSPPEGGLSFKSFVKCEDVRSIAKERLIRRTGEASKATLASVEDRLRILLAL
jgi:mRNA interferase MazF